MIERYSGAPEDIGLDTLGFHLRDGYDEEDYGITDEWDDYMSEVLTRGGFEYEY